jgi:EAL domain-containing protein (putative c-di-GMP-specific phosphodiesterase class I)
MLAARPTRQHAADLVRVLLIEGDTACAERVRDAFERIDCAYARLDTSASLPEAQARLKLEKFDLVIGDDAPGLRELVLENGAFDLVAKDGLDDAALQRFLRLANAHAAGSVRSLRRRDARFRKTFELARCQEALGRFGQAALALREPAELIDEAVRTVTHAVAAREARYIEAGDPGGASAALVDVLHCGVHYVCDGTCIVPVRREGEVRGALSAQGEGIGVETLPFLDTLASLLSTALQRIDSERRLNLLAQFDASRGSRARGHLALELERALERDEFRLVYQPKVDLRSRRPCGAEALLRWQHPERGMLAPAQFVPVLEETGLIVPVGEWAIARACEDLNGWRRAGARLLPVALNLSARQFRLPGLEQRIGALLKAAGVDPALIELEITESELMEDPEHAVRAMSALCEAGIRAAIDDFGTGHSSLAYLTRLPVAALKIDPSFIADALTDSARAAIVRAIIDMAHTLDFTAVAEGVETVGQMVFLRQFGCEQGQGFLFARPMSAAELRALL